MVKGALENEGNQECKETETEKNCYCEEYPSDSEAGRRTGILTTEDEIGSARLLQGNVGANPVNHK